MKKKLFFVLVLIMLCVVYSVKTMDLHNKSVLLSDITSDNVEVLSKSREGLFDFIKKRYKRVKYSCVVREETTYGYPPFQKKEVKEYPRHYYSCKEVKEGETSCSSTECEKN